MKKAKTPTVEPVLMESLVGFVADGRAVPHGAELLSSDPLVERFPQRFIRKGASQSDRAAAHGALRAMRKPGPTREQAKANALAAAAARHKRQRVRHLLASGDLEQLGINIDELVLPEEPAVQAIGIIQSPSTLPHAGVPKPGDFDYVEPK